MNNTNEWLGKSGCVTSLLYMLLYDGHMHSRRKPRVPELRTLAVTDVHPHSHYIIDASRKILVASLFAVLVSG